MQHTQRHRRVRLGLVFQRQVDPLPAPQGQPSGAVGEALGQVRADQVRPGLLVPYDARLVKAGERMGAQQVPDEGSVVKEAVEGGSAGQVGGDAGRGPSAPQSPPRRNSRYSNEMNRRHYV